LAGVFAVTRLLKNGIIYSVIDMTKQELLGRLMEKAVALDEDAIMEILYLTDKVAAGGKLEDEEAQLAASRKDFERGDTYTLDEVNRGVGR
jgi:hypothetical protein